jgi:hypothetical protein
MPVLNGKAWWAQHLMRPDDKFGDAKYKMDLVVADQVWKEVIDKHPELAKRTIDREKDHGVDERGHVIKFKRNSVTKKGVVKSPPKILDAKKNPLSNVLIGNGSDVRVVFNEFEMEREFNGWKWSYELEVVQVINLVALEGYTNVEDELSEEEGYTANVTSDPLDELTSQGDETFDDEIPF